MRKKTKLPHEFIRQFLHHAVFDGWSHRAIEVAARDVGLDKTTLRRLLPNGPRDLVWVFNDSVNTKMISELNKMDIYALPVRERVSTAIKVLLQQNVMHQEATRKMLTYLALPGNAGLGVKCIYETVDAIWRAAGDVSTDFNFYTKRGLLAGVYIGTVLYWLSDVSEDHSDTWAFLDRRIANVMQIPKLQSFITSRISQVPSPVRLLNRKRNT